MNTIAVRMSASSPDYFDYTYVVRFPDDATEEEIDEQQESIMDEADVCNWDTNEYAGTLDKEIEEIEPSDDEPEITFVRDESGNLVEVEGVVN